MKWALPDGVLPHVVDSAALDAQLDAVARLYDAELELIDNACKSLIMLGWATNEIVRCTWPDGRQTLRITVPREFTLDPNGDVFEVVRQHDYENYQITLSGRWLDWPMRY